MADGNEYWSTEDYQTYLRTGNMPLRAGNMPLRAGRGRKGTTGGSKKDTRAYQSKAYRSALEKAYAAVLGWEKSQGNIRDWKYEAVRLDLAVKTTLIPDFLVVENDGTVSFHETKGFRRDDAMAKLKIAAEQYPYFRFFLVARSGEAWHKTLIPPRIA